MTNEELYAHFSSLLQTMPDLRDYAALRKESDLWLARAYALVEASNSTYDVMEFRTAMTRFTRGSSLYPYAPDLGTEEITAIVLRCFAKLELMVAPSNKGGFIAAGSAFDAHKAIIGIFAEAKETILVVDPYMDHRILTEFTLVVPDNISIQLLSDSFYYKPAMKVASDRWIEQYGDTRPLAARLTPERVLHDRLIVIDNLNVWNVSQSFKDIAVRSPASIVKFDPETASLKLAAYDKIWNDAKPL